MNTPKISIIIPCFNCSKTIERLLNSIVNNDLEKDEYEIIVVDDCSIDDSLAKIKPYEEKANIRYFSTEKDSIHCPGNTRIIGLDNAEGEWITFIDNDDFFEPNIFKKVFNVIEEKNIKTMLCTSFYRPFLDENGQIINKYDKVASRESSSWLHGNFYYHQMLIDGNINFKKDLISHEDIYFNLITQCYLVLQNQEVYYEPELFTYNWVFREDSESNYVNGNITFLDIHFADYIYSVTEPYFNIEVTQEENPELFDFKGGCLLSNFLIGYFYYQSGLYRCGFEYPRENLKILYDFKLKLHQELEIADEDIVNYVYTNPDLYVETKYQAIEAVGKFVEVQSFRDFIANL